MEKNVYDQVYSDEVNGYWWNIARMDIVTNLIKKYFQEDKWIQILDVWCGTGYSLSILKKFWYENIWWIDNSEESVRLGNKNGIHVTKSELSELLNEDKKYDLILCLDVLEHIENHMEVVSQMNYLLKENGKIIITVPAFMFLWSHHDITAHHKRRYTKWSLISIFYHAGFRDVFVSYYNFFLFPPAFIFKYLNKKTQAVKENKGSFLNTILRKIFRFEWYFLEKEIKFPFGVSLIGIFSKK